MEEERKVFEIIRAGRALDYDGRLAFPQRSAKAVHVLAMARS
jgi:hypothetical protein